MRGDAGREGPAGTEKGEKGDRGLKGPPGQMVKFNVVYITIIQVHNISYF